SSTSIIYSGTMAAAMEGALYEIPSIGFSLLDWRTDADFSISKPYIQQLILKIIKHKYLDGICLNVNIPAVTKDEIQGIKICRQTKGHWIEEFEQRTDPHGREYYWLTGEFHNREPEAEDTDEWALINNYISVVPVHVDMTAYRVKEELDKIDFNADITQD
ncbi:MAG: 5'/3'-nucleotidase SurE, partial [Bacteroidota bacterium]